MLVVLVEQILLILKCVAHQFWSEIHQYYFSSPWFFSSIAALSGRKERKKIQKQVQTKKKSDNKVDFIFLHFFFFPFPPYYITKILPFAFLNHFFKSIKDIWVMLLI